MISYFRPIFVDYIYKQEYEKQKTPTALWFDCYILYIIFRLYEKQKLIVQPSSDIYIDHEGKVINFMLNETALIS